MKPDCQQILTQFASFSVEELSDSEAATLLQHIEDCEPCKGQWLLFEKSLTVMTQSGPRDEDVEQHRSQQMWLVCMEHARKNSEKKAALVAHAQASETVSAPPSALSHEEESDGETENSSQRVLVAPRLGMTMVGGALLILAASPWFGAPRPAAALPPVVAQAQTINAQTVALQTVATAPLVDYGATFGFNAVVSAVAGDWSAKKWVAVPTKGVFARETFAV